MIWAWPRHATKSLKNSMCYKPKELVLMDWWSDWNLSSWCDQWVCVTCNYVSSLVGTGYKSFQDVMPWLFRYCRVYITGNIIWYDGVISWKHFPRYWPFGGGGGIRRHQWIPLTKASDAEFWCFLWSEPWIYGSVNDREAGDLRRHPANYNAIVMRICTWYLHVHESCKSAIHIAIFTVCCCEICRTFALDMHIYDTFI